MLLVCKCQAKEGIKVNPECPIHGERTAFYRTYKLHSKLVKRNKLLGLSKPKRGTYEDGWDDVAEVETPLVEEEEKEE